VRAAPPGDEPPPPPPNRAPELNLSSEGTIAGTVGDAVEVRALATDADGGKPEVRFTTLSRPSGAGAIPSALQESGNARVLRFTPAMPGTYAFSFWARDTAGAESRRVEVRIDVADDEPPPPADPVVKEIRDTIALYERAWMMRDVVELNRYWTMTKGEKADIEAHMAGAERVIATVTPGDVVVKGSGAFAEVDVTQSIRRISGGAAEPFSPRYDGRFTFILARDREGWVINTILRR
jgi:hypothetical protein